MFRISDFSRFTRVSVKMLRHYDAIGLLRPARIDAESGYRYYSADQLPRLNRIILLKDLGFSLEEIARLLDGDPSAEEMKGILRLRQAEIERVIEAEQTRLAQLKARLHAIEQERRPLYDVILRAVPDQWMASLRSVVPMLGQPVANLFDEVEAFAAAKGIRAAASPLMLFHDLDYRETDLDVEVAVPVSGPLEGDQPGERVQVCQIPGCATMACAVYTGSYERTAEVFTALLIWMEANHRAAAGPLREVYLRFGADHAKSLHLPQAFLAEDPALFVTEIQLPVSALL